MSYDLFKYWIIFMVKDRGKKIVFRLLDEKTNERVNRNSLFKALKKVELSDKIVNIIWSMSQKQVGFRVRTE